MNCRQPSHQGTFLKWISRAVKSVLYNNSRKFPERITEMCLLVYIRSCCFLYMEAYGFISTLVSILLLFHNGQIYGLTNYRSSLPINIPRLSFGSQQLLQKEHVSCLRLWLNLSSLLGMSMLSWLMHRFSSDTLAFSHLSKAWLLCLLVTQIDLDVSVCMCGCSVSLCCTVIDWLLQVRISSHAWVNG